MLRYGLRRIAAVATAASAQGGGACAGAAGRRRTLVVTRHQSSRELRTLTKTTLPFLPAFSSLSCSSSSSSSSSSFRLSQVPVSQGIITRGFKYHESGWWEDQDRGGVTEAEPVESNPEVYRSLLAYVSDARKEEIYRLNKLEPEIFDAAVLSYLFNLSRVRVAAIIQLKAAEVERRLQGTLYTEEDDIFGEPDAAGTAVKSNGKYGKGKGGGGKLADPSELLLLDDESGLETMEDLCRPLGYEPVEKEMLPIQAALQHALLVERMGLVGEEAEKMMKPFKDKVDDVTLDELISKLDKQTATIATENENIIYNTTWAYEEKNQDEVPDPLNGFKILERREEGVLEDPAFLQYHVWMGLEQERLGLLLAHLRVQHEKKGGGGRQERHPAVSLYEVKELDEATEQYGRKKRRCAELFALLRPVHEKRVALAKEEERKEGEAEEGAVKAMEEEERGLMKSIRQELGPRIVTMEELSETRERVVGEIKRLAARLRRGVLVQGVKSGEEEGRKEKLVKYMELLRDEAVAEVQEEGKGGKEEGRTAFEDVQWEVLQQHRRVLRSDEALWGEAGREGGEVGLEQEVIDEILGMPEEEVEGLFEEGVHGSVEINLDRQQQALRTLLAAGGGREGGREGGRGEALREYVKTLYAEFSLSSSSSLFLPSSPSSSSAMMTRISKRAFAMFLMDMHECQPLRDRVDPMEVAAELHALCTSSSSSPSSSSSSLEVVRLALEEGTGRSPSLPPSSSSSEVSSSEVRAVERLYQQDVAHTLSLLKEARIKALKASRIGGGKKGDVGVLRRYLVTLAVSGRLEALDRLNKEVLSGLLPQLTQAFRGKTEVVASAYSLLVEQLYGGKRIEAPAIAELAALAGRTEGWVEGILLKLMKTSQEEVGRGDVLMGAHPGRLAQRLVTQDCFQAGIRSKEGLKVVREEMIEAGGKVGGDDVREVEERWGLPVEVEEVRLLAADALEKTIGSHIEGNASVFDALRARKGGKEGQGIEERARAAKALLEHLRSDGGAYAEYVAAVKDRIVEEIEEELLDTVYDMSEDLRMELDPVLVDLKPREHYDVPSLKFRVLNDNEPSVSDGVRRGFLEEGEEEEGVVGEGELWKPREVLRDLSASEASRKGRKGASGEGVQQRRWSFAFKDAALPGGGAGGAEGGTVVRDRTGRLRAASGKEEKARSWIRRAQRIDLRGDN